MGVQIPPSIIAMPLWRAYALPSVIFPVSAWYGGYRVGKQQDGIHVLLRRYSKRTGVSHDCVGLAKDIRLFMEWCVEGPSTYPKRKAMFEDRKAHMESEIANMNRALDMLKFKCWYYEQAIQDGSEDRLKTLIPNNLPEEIKEAYENAHAR